MSLLDGLVSYWKLDENIGSGVGDVVGGNTGSWNGTLGSQWTPGKINSGGNFNGTDNTISTGTNLTSNFQNHDFSIAGWIYPTDNTTDRVIWQIGTDGTDQHLHIHQTGGGSPTIAFYGDDVGGNINIPINNWTHLAITYQDSTKTRKSYINGAIDINNIASGHLNIPNNSVFYMGLSLGSLSNWKGKIDEVGVWNRILTQTDVNQLYNSGTGLQYPFANQLGLQGTGATGVSNYLKNTLIPLVTDIRSSNIYDSEVTDLAGYPACTITLTGVDSKVLDNNRNQHIFKFSIKLFIDRSKTNFGNSTAESILRNMVNNLITQIDSNPTLGGNCIIAKPFNAQTLYINRQNQDIRYMEVILEVIDANTFR